MRGTKELISPEEITKHFYQSRVATARSSDDAFSTTRRDLTASAKYVVREAKKILGQQSVSSAIAQPQEEDLLRLIRHIEDAQQETLTETERTSVIAALSASLDYYDILTPLIENGDVNDIIIRSYDDISVQSDRANIQTDLTFADHDTYRAFVENLLKRAGKSCTVATPVVDAAIDPQVRACVTHESFSPVGSGPMLTLRIARHRQISLESLAHYQLAPQIVLEYLAAIVSSGATTVLIAGEVGTGKTTLVKALASRIPEHEAILVIEDTNEISLSRKFVRTLLTREANTEGAGRISPALAIRTGMRMAMNRLILGEMRDAEAAEAFVDVAASGHAGMSTIHAKSAKDALARLEIFLSRAQPGAGIETVRRQIANSVGVVVYLGLDKQAQRRRIFEVAEVGRYADGSVQFSPMFKFSAAQEFPEWRRESGVSEFQECLSRNEVRLPPSGQTVGFAPEDLYRTANERNR